MKRKTFILLSALVAFIFGLSMLFTPDQMIRSMTTSVSSSTVNVVQWAGCMLLSIAVINFFASSDEGSVALRAVMFGNVVTHVLGAMLDGYQYYIGFIMPSGLITGMVVHGVLGLGFTYYLLTMGKGQQLELFEK